MLSSSETFFKPIEYKPDPSNPINVFYEQEKDQLIFVGKKSRLENFIAALYGKCYIGFDQGEPQTLIVQRYIQSPGNAVKMTPDLATKVIIPRLHKINLITESEKVDFIKKINEPAQSIAQETKRSSLCERKS